MASRTAERVEVAVVNGNSWVTVFFGQTFLTYIVPFGNVVVFDKDAIEERKEAEPEKLK